MGFRALVRHFPPVRHFRSKWGARKVAKSGHGPAVLLASPPVAQTSVPPAAQTSVPPAAQTPAPPAAETSAADADPPSSNSQTSDCPVDTGKRDADMLLKLSEVDEDRYKEARKAFLFHTSPQDLNTIAAALWLKPLSIACKKAACMTLLAPDDAVLEEQSANYEASLRRKTPQKLDEAFRTFWNAAEMDRKSMVVSSLLDYITTEQQIDPDEWKAALKIKVSYWEETAAHIASTGQNTQPRSFKVELPGEIQSQTAGASANPGRPPLLERLGIDSRKLGLPPDWGW